MAGLLRAQGLDGTGGPWGVCVQLWSLEASGGREGKSSESGNFCQGACMNCPTQF